MAAAQDSEIRKNFQRSLTKQGFKFKLGYKVTGASVDGDTVTLAVENVKDGKTEELTANVVLVSAGAQACHHTGDTSPGSCAGAFHGKPMYSNA